MARLLGFRARNFRSLRDFTIGQVQYAKGDPLPGLVCLIGPNGCGKSSVLDAFGFIADCLLEGVQAACDKPFRGGFDRLRTQGVEAPIEFEIFFDAGDRDRPIVYEVAVDLVGGVPCVVKECLRQRQRGETVGRPYYFLKLGHGKGKVWAGERVEQKARPRDAQRVQLAELDRLGIASLGNLSEHPRIVALRTYIEEWYLSYFVPEAARALPPSGAQRFLDRTGSNIGNVLQYYQRQYPKKFAAILERLARAIPGLKRITPEITPDKRLLLRFDEQGYVDPFYQQSMSDGTLKMLAYAVLMEDPEPRPFIGIEEPENGLYVRLVERLAHQFAARATQPSLTTQILITTHSPYFVDALNPEQVWLLRKDANGHTGAYRASDQPTVLEMTKQGIPLGSVWYSNYFEDGAPR